MEKIQFVTPAEYAASEFDFSIILPRHWIMVNAPQIEAQ